ncbi:hypothetical protein AGMMS49990_10210 [Endomicrobiia bacterium]|nr:hypothetical protein AGMMS49990_10210 [Endomicrobiia bacterium]
MNSLLTIVSVIGDEDKEDDDNELDELLDEEEELEDELEELLDEEEELEDELDELLDEEEELEDELEEGTCAAALDSADRPVKEISSV